MQKSLIAMLLLASAGAYASDAADEQANRSAFAGERTRAEVQAELRQEQLRGAVGAHSDLAAYLQQPAVTAGRDRADVRAEAVQAARIRVIQESI
jgi:hypothetical protein